MDSVIPDSHLSATVQQQFAGFSYANTQQSLASGSLMSSASKFGPGCQKASVREQVGKDKK
jgi:hypothetical protein